MQSSDKKFRTYLARSAVGAIFLTILILVSTARAVTAWLKENITTDQQTYNTVLAIGGGVTFIVVFFYFFLTKQRLTFKYWFLHAVLICIPLSLIPLQMTHPTELAHIPLYASLTIAITFSFARPQEKYVPLKTFFMALSVGLFDEFLQWLHPDRFCDLHDIALNTTAITLGLILAEPFRNKWN